MKAVATHVLLIVALLAAVSSTALAQVRGMSKRDYREARKVLESFDPAWADSDLDALMDPVSPSFGCEIYGQIDPVRLKLVYADLIADLAGSRCSTEIHSLADDGKVIQAYVCRLFHASDDTLLEEQCQLIYLRRERARIRIVGLEEFDHEGFEAIADGRYRSATTLLSFAIPEQTFVVPRPRVGFALEHLLLRGEQLQTEIELLLIRTSSPFQLAPALDHDLRDWERRNAPAKIELLTDLKVSGFPARKAVARYRGSECSLDGGSQQAEQRHLVRVYVQLDETYLLAVDLRTPSKLLKSASRDFDRLLDSFRVELPEGETYAGAVRQQHGFNRLSERRFENRAAGIQVEAPPGFELELSESSSLFSLRALRADGTPSAVRIDGVELIDPAVSLDEMIAVDDAAYQRFSEESALKKSTRSREVGGQSAVQVDRLPDSDPAGRLETVVYLTSGAFIITVRIAGSVDEIRDAQQDLEAILDSISIRREN